MGSLRCFCVTPQFLHGSGRLWGITVNVQEQNSIVRLLCFTHFVNARLHAQNYRSIDFCNVYTYIYTYIEQSLLEVCMFFSWISNCKTVPLKPQNHMTRILLEQRKVGVNFLASVFFIFWRLTLASTNSRAGVT